MALNLVDTATSLIRTPAGGISVREWIRSFSQDATKLRGGAADPLLAGAGGGNVRAAEGRIPDQAMASTGSRSAEGKQAQAANRDTDRKPVYSTDDAAAVAAAQHGYRKTNYRTNKNAAIFRKGNSYITRDVDNHSGGAWKEASSPRALNHKSTRRGTLDQNMRRIGD